MSTFRGIVQEFPDIRIDFFRIIQDVRPPLACFLSHVHSDHLAGLESLKAPFVYCSAAAKELLLRLERYPHRMNFAKGILESRKQHYKHLKNLLKPIPLDTPTCIELSPGKKIQVTLFDANHCTGAVMFLIEDANNAILYTGDIRSEPWFVNRLARSPFLVEYSSGLKTLDCIYLDTSNVGNDLEFPTKAEGLKELIEKVSKYPKDTTFHFAAWTFGYEEVWMMLSRVLNSPIHVDNYKMRLYQSLRGDNASNGGKDFAGPALSHEASVLAGYKCGNTDQPGILTNDQTVKLHSCEKGTSCTAIKEQNIVWIQPIVCRTRNMEVAEVGIGGGGGDLTQKLELELDDHSINQLIQLFAKIDHKVVDEVQKKLLKALHSSINSLSIADTGMDHEEDELSLDELTKVLIRSLTRKGQESNTQVGGDEHVQSNILPKTITFPYSRHSSHSELCYLLKAFRPADVYPCTVDEDSWHEGISIKAIFGEYCSKSHFRHDAEMRALKPFGMEDNEDEEDVEMIDTQHSRASSEEVSMPPPGYNLHRHAAMKLTSLDGNSSQEATSLSNNSMSQRANLQEAHSLHTPVNSELSVAVTPSSESQGRRRKAVEEFVRDPAKRIRSSSPNQEESAHISEDIGDEDRALSTYHDFRDDVFRCNKCHWEVWMPNGYCTVCETGEDAYEESEAPSDDDPEDSDEGIPFNPMHNLRKAGTDLEIDPAILGQLKEQFLDYATSAYSDENDTDSEDYETNSMIDDASIDSGDDEREKVIDWKAKYKALERKHNILLQSLQAEDDGFLSYNSDSVIIDSEGYGEGDVRMVEVHTQDPQLAEVVLLDRDSQQADTQMTMADEDLEELIREAAEFTKDMGSQLPGNSSTESQRDGGCT